MAKIYTRQGDRGRTLLLGGIHVSKGDPRLDLLGNLDELSCQLGSAASQAVDRESRSRLHREQGRLLSVGAAIAGDARSSALVIAIASKWTQQLEDEIDRDTHRLPALTEFILPGGCPAGAATHVARSICRRAERSFFSVVDQNTAVASPIGVYLNRLGDWLFTLARAINQRADVGETRWQPETMP